MFLLEGPVLGVGEDLVADHGLSFREGLYVREGGDGDEGDLAMFEGVGNSFIVKVGPVLRCLSVWFAVFELHSCAEQESVEIFVAVGVVYGKIAISKAAVLANGGGGHLLLAPQVKVIGGFVGFAVSRWFLG
jgi:hypothetical protein